MSKSLRIEAVPGGLIVNGKKLMGCISTERFRQALGDPSRCEIKYSKGRPWRVVAYYDEEGVYALEDLGTNLTGYIGIALIPEHCPFRPTSAFHGLLMVNGKPLLAGMKFNELPLQGDMNFVKGIGSTWKYAHDNGYDELNMMKLTKSEGRKTSGLGLVSFTHTFLEE